jgi:hypothetical protein
VDDRATGTDDNKLRSGRASAQWEQLRSRGKVKSGKQWRGSGGMNDKA